MKSPIVISLEQRMLQKLLKKTRLPIIKLAFGIASIEEKGRIVKDSPIFTVAFGAIDMIY